MPKREHWRSLPLSCLQFWPTVIILCLVLTSISLNFEVSQKNVGELDPGSVVDLVQCEWNSLNSNLRSLARLSGDKRAGANPTRHIVETLLGESYEPDGSSSARASQVSEGVRCRNARSAELLYLLVDSNGESHFWSESTVAAPAFPSIRLRHSVRQLDLKGTVVSSTKFILTRTKAEVFVVGSLRLGDGSAVGGGIAKIPNGPQVSTGDTSGRFFPDEHETSILSLFPTLGLSAFLIFLLAFFDRQKSINNGAITFSWRLVSLFILAAAAIHYSFLASRFVTCLTVTSYSLGFIFWSLASTVVCLLCGSAIIGFASGIIADQRYLLEKAGNAIAGLSSMFSVFSLDNDIGETAGLIVISVLAPVAALILTSRKTPSRNALLLVMFLQNAHENHILDIARDSQAFESSRDFLLSAPSVGETSHSLERIESFLHLVAQIDARDYPADQVAFILFAKSDLFSPDISVALQFSRENGRSSQYLQRFDMPLLAPPMVSANSWADSVCYGEKSFPSTRLNQWSLGQLWFQQIPGFRKEFGVLPRSIAGPSVSIIPNARSSPRTSGEIAGVLGSVNRSQQFTTENWIVSISEREFPVRFEDMFYFTIFWIVVLIANPQNAGATGEDRRRRLWIGHNWLIRGWLRSYIGKYLIAFTCTVIVPASVLFFFVSKYIEKRFIAEQLNSTLLAAEAAERFVIDYIEGLEPGIALETRIDKELLVWISKIIGRRIDVYWGKDFFSSSNVNQYYYGKIRVRIPFQVLKRISEQSIYRAADLSDDSSHAEGREAIVRLSLAEAGNFEQRGIHLAVASDLSRTAISLHLSTLRRRALIAIIALWLSLTVVARRLVSVLSDPISALIAQTDQVASGSKPSRFRSTDEEFAPLVTAIVKMDMRIGANMSALARERDFVRKVVDNINLGVVLLDDKSLPIFMNHIGAILVSEIEEDVHRTQARYVARRTDSDGFVRWRHALEIADSRVFTSCNEETKGQWEVDFLEFDASFKKQTLVIMKNLSESLRIQRLEAQMEISRIVAHEIKNPLTPIRLSAEHLIQVVREGRPGATEAIERCVDNILRQVDVLRELAAEFSFLGRRPHSSKRLEKILPIVASTVEHYYWTPFFNLIEIIPSTCEASVLFDSKQIERAIRNVIENALRASIESKAEPQIQLRVQDIGTHVSIRVTDNGPGIEPQLLSRIFQPYFSTYSSGTGLGLAIAKAIVEDHGGAISGRNLSGCGFEVEIKLPVANAGPRG